MKRKGDPKKHHYVPQSYLRRFANDRAHLQVVERAPPHRRYTSHVKDVAAEKDFYLVETDQGASLAVETALSEIESEARMALERLVLGQFAPTSEDRATLSAYIALQWLRGRNQRDIINREYERFTKFFLRNMPPSQLRRRLRDVHGREPTDAEVEQMKAFFADEAGYTITPHQNFSIGLILKMVEGLGRVASSFTWKLVRFDEPCLLTSDTPVVMWTHPDRLKGPVPMTQWLSDEVLFAVDPQHALVLVNDHRSGAVAHSGTSMVAHLFNYHVACRSYRRIFHHPDIDPLAGMTLPPRTGD